MNNKKAAQIKTASHGKALVLFAALIKLCELKTKKLLFKPQSFPYTETAEGPLNALPRFFVLNRFLFLPLKYFLCNGIVKPFLF